MPKALAPEKREAIAADIRAGGMSRNDIARKHNVAASTVGNIAEQEGITDAFDRTHTLKGARAKAADNKALRAQLQSDLLADAQRLRSRAWAPYKIAMPGMEGPEIIELDLPPLQEVRAAYTSIGIVVDKDLAYERAAQAAGGGTAEQRSLLGKLFEGLAQAVREPETPQDDC